MTVTFIDTSVLCEVLGVPGKSDPARAAAVREELERRWQEGEQLVIPVTTVIETGNHIAQADSNRYEVAARLVRLLRSAVAGESPWRVLQTDLGTAFLTALCDGDSTGQSLEALAAAKMGAGDLAILVERDQLLSGSAVRSVEVWTFDEGLKAQAAIR